MKEKFINKPLFKLQRKSTLSLFIIFSAVVSFLILLTLAVYPLMEEMLRFMPEELKAVMDMTSISEYFNVEAFELWMLLVCIMGSATAINLTTNEFRNGSYELIYTLNISRKEVVRTKLIRLILNVLYVNLIIASVSAIGLFIFGKGQFSIVNLLIYTLFAILVSLQISLLIFSLGLVKKKSFNSFLGILIVMAMFIITTISISVDKLEWLGYFSPLTTMYGTIMMSGFKGLPSNGIIFGVWSVVVILNLIFSTKKFKNDDLC